VPQMHSATQLQRSRPVRIKFARRCRAGNSSRDELFIYGDVKWLR